MTKRTEQLVLALSRGLSYADAAAEAGCSVRTVARRMADPGFREHVRETRVKLLDAATGKLADAAGIAVEALRELATSGESETVRVSAARALLALLLPLREQTDLEARIDKLEETILNDHRTTHRANGATHRLADDR